jgi:GAF domain-containing protein
VARGAAAIRDLEQLLKETVHLISDRFGFYHAGIFLLDEARQYAVLRAASSEGGGHMLARRHKLKVGEEGIVGYAVGTGEPRIALDVGEDAVFFNNPDLPMTHSEMAVPLKVHDQIIGVLDVQSTEPAAFSEEDVAILQALADQVSLAIENARLFEQSQRALQDLDALYGRRARKAWQEQVARQPAAYHYTGLGVEPASASAELKTGAQALENTGDDQRLTAPIRLRGQSIGSIVLRQDSAAEPWSSEEMALVDEVSTQIGLALENARLLEEAQRQAQREHVIRQVTEQMRRAVNVETVLQTTVAKLGQAMAAPRVYVRLGTELGSGRGNGNSSASPEETSGSSQPSGDTA